MDDLIRVKGQGRGKEVVDCKGIPVVDGRASKSV